MDTWQKASSESVSDHRCLHLHGSSSSTVHGAPPAKCHSRTRPFCNKTVPIGNNASLQATMPSQQVVQGKHRSMEAMVLKKLTCRAGWGFLVEHLT